MSAPPSPASPGLATGLPTPAASSRRPDRDARPEGGPNGSRESGRGAIMEDMQRRVSSPVFVGRNAELSALDAPLARAADGRPPFGFVGGETGVG
jgi:hypothetical protein